ncbi:HAD family hydrolase [Streptomyces mobaraensis]|nr:HAD family phosphatase [Streptomyces mobaraensis]
MRPPTPVPESAQDTCPALPPRIAAVVFDADSVLTDLAHLQTATWGFVLDAYLRERAPGSGAKGPDAETELPAFLDDGHLTAAVTSFCELRGLGFGSLRQAVATAHDLSVRRQAILHRYLHHYGVGVRRGTAELLTDLRRRGVRCAAVSGTARARGLLTARGLVQLLDVVLDGDDRARLRSPARPDPVQLLHAARLLGADPRETAVVDAAPRGVRAAARGGFGRIVGLTPPGDVRRMTELFRHGADLVVHDLGQLRGGARAVPAAA